MAAVVRSAAKARHPGSIYRQWIATVRHLATPDRDEWAITTTIYGPNPRIAEEQYEQDHPGTRVVVHQETR
jgi:hypothetical protein